MKIEIIKEKISWYKHLFTFSSAIDFACIGWLVGNYLNAEKTVLILNMVTIVCFTLGMLYSGYKVHKHIKIMEKINA